MFNYQPPQYNHIKCPYHRIFHTVKNTQYGGHEACFHEGQCVSSPQCSLYESCPTHETYYEEEIPNYQFHYVPQYTSPNYPSPISHNVPSNYVPHYVAAPEAHFQRKVEETRLPNVTVKRVEKKKKSKQPKCHCSCNQNKSPFSNAVPTATPSSIPSFPVQLLPSMSDWTYYWILQLLEHMEMNSTEQNQKFATAICEYFKFSTPTLQPSISSLLQEIAEKTKKDTTNIKVDTANNETGPKNDTKTTDVWMDAINKIGNESGDPRMKQFVGLMTEAVKISQNPEGQNGLTKVFTDLFLKNMNDTVKDKNVKVETKPESHPVDPVACSQNPNIIWLDTLNKIGNESGEPKIKQFADLLIDTLKSSQNPDGHTTVTKVFTDFFMKNINDVLKEKDINVELKPVDTKTGSHPVDPVTFGKNIKSVLQGDPSTLNSIFAAVEKNCVAEADKVLNEYIQQSDASILDSMNEARINKALEDMD
jgi:hypothetical protein